MERKYRQDFYYNGKVKRGKSKYGHVHAILMLDRVQAEWSKHLMPQVRPGEFDPNNGSEVVRVSEHELLVTTTGGHKLRFVNVEVEENG